MRSLMNFFGGLRIRSLNPLIAVVLLFAVVVGRVGQADAQTSRYTLDDVMDKLIEVDKRLTVVETEVKRNRELIETVNTNLTKQIEMVNTNLGDRISATNTTMRWLFGLLVALFGSILVFVFNIARSMRPAESSKAFRKEGKAITERERALEEKLQAEDRRAPQETRILEALEQKVDALAERQKELEGKLKLAEVI
ncbi:MAG TPA: hypothetical protein EYP19_12300 [Desulfobacterales bacterium]|nr:hypothetical protein [Desulfobacterales bacterium]